MSVASRRQVLAGGTALLAASAVRAGDRADGIAGIEAALGGRLGVHAIATGSSREVAYRADERFAMCSTFKSALAAAVLQRIDDGAIAGDEVLRYEPAAVLPTSPVSARAGGHIGVLAACEAIVSWSDNTAANLLLERIGGPAVLTGFFRTLGDDVSRLDRYEMELNSHAADDPRDTTAPRAMARTLGRLLLGDALDPASRDLLSEWMRNEQNGKARVRAGVPSSWRVANKPGTNTAGATNDIAVAWPPAGAPIVLSVFVDAPGADATARQRAIADVAGYAASVLAGSG